MTLEEARTILGPVIIPGDSGLQWHGSQEWDYIRLIPGSGTVYLDGHFTVRQLEAIAVWLKEGVADDQRERA